MRIRALVLLASLLAIAVVGCRDNRPVAFEDSTRGIVCYVTPRPPSALSCVRTAPDTTVLIVKR